VLTDVKTVLEVSAARRRGSGDATLILGLALVVRIMVSLAQLARAALYRPAGGTLLLVRGATGLSAAAKQAITSHPARARLPGVAIYRVGP
jgi:hypothetical protein